MSFGILVSVLVPNYELALSIQPVITIPFMLFGGFFSNTNNIPYIFKPFEYISIIKYGYAASL